MLSALLLPPGFEWDMERCSAGVGVLAKLNSFHHKFAGSGPKSKEFREVWIKRDKSDSHSLFILSVSCRDLSQLA